MRATSRPTLDRLLERVEPDLNSGCWLWSGAVTTTGYGAMKMRDRGAAVRRTHRLSWECHFGPIPKGMNVCHKCDTPPCCNPAHLFLGTCEDNSRDMAIKRRHRHKLSEAQVREILSKKLTITEYARKFGVSKVTAWQAWHGETWRHLQPQ